MGQTKQLLAWPTPEGNKPLVAAAFDAIQPICSTMVVVLGHDSEAVASALGTRLFHRASSNPDAPMFQSIRAGLRAAQALNPAATVVLHLADHPEVNPNTLAALSDWSLQQRPAHAIIPQHANRGGHPIFIPATICQTLLNAACPQGLGQFWIDNPHLVTRISIDDPSLTRDIDTPADLTQ